jgi:prevent-host-death family protein
MAQYGVAEAKNNFTHLLDRVEAGENITITRHGKPVAELRAAPKQTLEERRAALKALAEWRSQFPPLPMSAAELVRQMRDEGA